MKKPDYYKILEVDKNVSKADLKKAYRKQARRYHPDVNTESSAEEKFKQANEAYEVLKDPEKRQAYDNFGHNWERAPGFSSGGTYAGENGFSGADFSDFFESVFSGKSDNTRSRRSSQQQRIKGGDQILALDITLEEAFHGGAKMIQLSATDQAAGNMATHGMKKLKVNIPKGVTSGKKIRLSNQGHPSPNGGPAGDLLLELQILPHYLYQLNDKDVTLKLPLAPWEAALGAELKVPTLSGDVSLKIRPGIQTGQKMRLKGKGLPASPPGDQYVEIQIQTPAASTEDEKVFYQDMQNKFQFTARKF